MNEPAAFGAQLLLLSAGAVALIALLSAARWVVGLFPGGQQRRDAVTRLSPVVGTIAALAYLLFAARQLLGAYPSYLPVAVVLILGAFIAASWPAIRDFVSGVFLKAGRVCSVGDSVRIGEVQGRVERLGLRSLVLETSQGDEAVIPYSQLVRESVLRTPVIDGVAVHVFRTPQPAHSSLAEVKARAREAAMLSHWASIVRSPEVTLLPEGQLEITVFALDADHAPEVEASVRQALASSPSERAARPTERQVTGSA